MLHALIMVVDISAMLTPQVTIIRCFEIQVMLTTQNIVLQMHLFIYIINNKE